MARPNLIPNAFNLGKSENVHFSINVQAEIIILARNVKREYSGPINIYLDQKQIPH